MKLTLVRHGRPNEGDPVRPHDPGLRDDGQAQAEAVARVLAGEGVTRIVASPLLRAQETARPLAARLGLPVHTVDGWAEADRHASRYLTTETLLAAGPERWQAFLADPVGFFGGDEKPFRAGVIEALAALLEEGGRRDHVVVFAHGLPINAVLSHLLGLQRIVHFQPYYGSLTRLRSRGRGRAALTDGTLAIVSVNETGHLPPRQPRVAADAEAAAEAANPAATAAAGTPAGHSFSTD